MRRAVVLIHGIGEQYPMDNLRELVNSLKPKDGQIYSSPNRIIGDLETRRLSYRNRSVDFYEFYWANLVEEPRFGEVLSWFFTILFSSKPSPRFAEIRNKLLALLFVLLVLVSALIYLFNDYLFDLENLITNGALAFIIYKVVFPMIKDKLSKGVLSVLGDVVKYTIPSPKNIAVRTSIRNKGINLIKSLHEAKDENGNDVYGSIVLVGHSLGSVIGYNILANAFAEYHKKYQYNAANPDTQPELIALINYTKLPKKDFNAEHYQKLQTEATKAMEKHKFGWKVTDFISLGSPLTHAQMLLAKTYDEFENKVELREFPTCPPVIDENDEFLFCFKPKKDLLVPHHAGHFALTRWTNLYFKKDYIGGKLAPIFGRGIVDKQITPKKPDLMGSHTKYWSIHEKEVLELLKMAFRL